MLFLSTKSSFLKKEINFTRYFKKRESIFIKTTFYENSNVIGGNYHSCSECRKNSWLHIWHLKSYMLLKVHSKLNNNLLLLFSNVFFILSSIFLLKFFLNIFVTFYIRTNLYKYKKKIMLCFLANKGNDRPRGGYRRAQISLILLHTISSPVWKAKS